MRDEGRHLIFVFFIFFKVFLKTLSKSLLHHQDQPCTAAKLNPSILVEKCVSSEAVIVEHMVKALIQIIRKSKI